MRRALTGHLYRRYITSIMDRLDEDRLPEDWMPEDWLALSSGVVGRLISGAVDEPPPSWCRTVTWLEYAEKRYDRVKALGVRSDGGGGAERLEDRGRQDRRVGAAGRLRQARV